MRARGAQEWEAPGLKDKLTAAAKAYLNLADADTDGRISPTELKAFVLKAVRFAFALAHAALLTAKTLALSVLAAASTIVLVLKAHVVGGSPDSLSEADVLCLVASIAREPRRFLASLYSVRVDMSWRFDYNDETKKLKIDLYSDGLRVYKNEMVTDIILGIKGFFQKNPDLVRKVDVSVDCCGIIMICGCEDVLEYFDGGMRTLEAKYYGPGSPFWMERSYETVLREAKELSPMVRRMLKDLGL